MACDFCNCFSLGCSPNCCDFEFIINNTPVLATQNGVHVLSYIQEGQNNKKGALQFLIGDPILFPAAWFNSEGLVKFELTLPDNTIFEFETYTCFEFERVISATPENSEMVVCLGSNNPSDICTVCDLLEALGVSSQLLVEIRDKVLFLDVPLSELGKETTLQDILTAINAGGGAYALESTLQLVLTALNGLALDSTLQSILTALGTGLAQETTLQTVAKETTLQSVLTALSGLSTQTTLAQVLTQLQTLNLVDFSTETTLQALLLAIQSLPAGGDATAANQVLEIAQLTTLNSKDFSTEATLQSVLAALLLSGQEITLQSILTALGPLATEVTLGQVLTELQTVTNVLLQNIDNGIANIGSYMTYLQNIDNNITVITSVLSTQLDIPLTSLQADIQNINASLATTNNELSNLNTKDFATETTLSNLNSNFVSGFDVVLSTRASELTALEIKDNIGATNETVAATDTSTSGLNGLFKRLLQRITTLITNIGSPFQAGGSIGNTQFGATQVGAWTVTANAGTNLNTSLLATESTQTTQNTRIGDLIETAPVTDTASSGLNGRLQRIAQRLTSLIGLFPTSLGQKTMANSLAVTIASDQSSLNVNVNNTVTSSTITPITVTTAVSNGTQSLIIANASRKGLVIKNNTNRTIYVAYGATANTSNNNSFTIAANGKEIIEIGANLAFSFSIVQPTATGTINLTSIL